MPANDPAPTTDRLYFSDDGRTPNNRYPVLIHHDVGTEAGGDRAEALENLLADNGWPPQWRGGVFDFHHYHSNAHEVLAAAEGSAQLMLGGESGEVIDIAAGDVLILPAGTGHCRLSASRDFLLVAGYPEGQGDWDLCRSGKVDHAAAIKRIAATADPARDPVTGAAGGVCAEWK